MMNDRGKSDRPVVPTKSSNKTGIPVAEKMEGRGLTKGKPRRQNTQRTLCRQSVQSKPERIHRVSIGSDRIHMNFLYSSVSSPAVRAGCVSSARPDPCGGRSVMAVPTATRFLTFGKTIKRKSCRNEPVSETHAMVSPAFSS